MNQNLIHIIRPIEGWLSDHEALLLFHLARLSPAGEVVEIGSWKGKSTICLALGKRASGTSGMISAIDPHQGIIKTNTNDKTASTYAAFLKNIRAAGIADLVMPIKKTSKAAAAQWRKPIQLLFIDGLHDYLHAHEDYTLWSPHLAASGIIAFHDGFCGEVGVWKAIHESCFARTDIVDIGTVSSILYVVLGKPSVIDQMRVAFKKNIIYLAYQLHQYQMSWHIKKLIIHKLLRLLLLTEYTVAVYT